MNFEMPTDCELLLTQFIVAKMHDADPIPMAAASVRDLHDWLEWHKRIDALNLPQMHWERLSACLASNWLTDPQFEIEQLLKKRKRPYTKPKLTKYGNIFEMTSASHARHRRRDGVKGHKTA